MGGTVAAAVGIGLIGALGFNFGAGVVLGRSCFDGSATGREGRSARAPVFRLTHTNTAAKASLVTRAAALQANQQVMRELNHRGDNNLNMVSPSSA